MISDTTIRKLVDYISLNACSVNSSGLYNGKSRISLALFETAKCLQDTEIEDKAFSLFQESLIRKKSGYEDMIPNETYPILKIDANQSINKVYASIAGTLKEVYPHIYSE